VETEVNSGRFIVVVPVRRSLILGVVGGLVLAGCSGGKTDSPSPQTAARTMPTTAELEGDPTAGKQIFERAGCRDCHLLKDAGGIGTVGPNLDQAKPPLALVVERVTNGSGAMPSFTANLSEQQIADVAAYVVQATQG
jgi:mono/diheme cytochrome c family protein